jgi:phosphoribosylamine--glycine ligase
MLTADGPKVLEYNVRFGDPETQVVMMRLNSDLFKVLWACAEGTLSEVFLEWTDEASVCVVMAAPGYPLSYPKGIPILLPTHFERGQVVFHAGTAVSENGDLVSSGGRVLGVTSTGNTIKEARDAAYSLIEAIDFRGAHYRRDIGVRGI